ncbi:putative protein of unknown function (DUF4586) [Blattamonas nauphoetae]|uniref:Cilia-and flagella-associated protein 96 n=1 Tax=Blattamonas nauphoetae TaxID=2049346 RepID=A0ABQ9XUE0_9EUKA|nr:putative protein of unknown function (DUF4586) [Blattamonas nauphoetae]
MSRPSSTSNAPRRKSPKKPEFTALSPYLGVGEPYIERPDALLVDSRFKGKQMIANPPKKGNSTIGEFLSLATTEPYETKPRLTKNDVRSTSPKPFITRSAPKTGQLAVFSSPEYIPEPEVRKTRSTSASPRAQRGIFTSPPRRGGSGTPGTTIGGFKYEYIPEPYGGDRNKLKKMKDPRPPPTPFLSRSTPLSNFDNSVYSPVAVNRTRTRAERRRERQEKAKREELGKRPPFRASSPGTKSLMGTFSPFPEYIPGDNDQPRRPRTVSGGTSRVFRPSGTAHVFRSEKTGV